VSGVGLAGANVKRQMFGKNERQGEEQATKDQKTNSKDPDPKMIVGMGQRGKWRD